MSAPWEGLCECGCGQRTELATRTDRRRGLVAGQPRRFVTGHKSHPLGPVPFELVDTGFSSPCWLWLRSKNSEGYALRRGKQYTTTLVHRQHYEFFRGPVPDGLDLDHLCRVRHCVNPEHVEPVTRATNAHRGAGTKLTPEQVREIKVSPDSTAELARRFGVAHGAVWNIRAGLQWKDVV